MSTLKASPLTKGTAKVSCFAVRRVADRDTVYIVVFPLVNVFSGYKGATVARMPVIPPPETRAPEDVNGNFDEVGCFRAAASTGWFLKSFGFIFSP